MYMYTTSVPPASINEFTLLTCHPRCESCVDWLPDVCITCNDDANRTGAPDCSCKVGYEDEYDHLTNKICR